MQEPRMVSPEGVPPPKPRKKKPIINQVTPTIQKKGEIYRGKETLLPPPKTKKYSKKNPKIEASPPFQQMDASTPDSMVDASISSGDYRALRHKYLLLEEESVSLDRELNQVEGDVKTLEDDKFALLDQLVVLEGLMDPSELKQQGRQ